MKKPKIPQKLEEQLCDAMENFGIYADQVSDISYHTGYLDGAIRVYTLMKKGADFEDIAREINELRKDYA